MAKNETDPDTNPQDLDVESGDSDTAGDSGDDTSAALTLEEINEKLGRTYKDKEAALKSLKDTRDQVGALSQQKSALENKLREALGDTGGDKTAEEKDLDAGKQPDTMTRQEFETEMFFRENADHAARRDVIEALADKHDVSPSEVVEMDVYKGIHEQSQELDELKSKQSVVMSDGRVAGGSEKLQEANEAMKSSTDAQAKGDIATANKEHARAKETAISAVMENFSGDES